MSIYISGVDLPKDSEHILSITINHDGTVYRNLDLKCKTIATAISVPQHGDLIDRDVLMEEFERAEAAKEQHGQKYTFSFESNGEMCTEWGFVQGALDDAPTVIPAEEGE